MRKLTLLAATIFLSSCSFAVKLPLPPQPDYPTVTASELQCLSDTAYESLVRRDKLKSAHIERLENIIKSTR